MKSRGIFIIGPQGSGSSCLAGALHSAGISMGSDLRGPSPLNPKGHFEDLEFEILASREDAAERDDEFCAYFQKRSSEIIWGLKSYQLAFCYKFVLPYVNDFRILSIDRPEEGAIRSSLVKYGAFKSRESIEYMHASIRRHRSLLIEDYNITNLDINFNELTDNPSVMIEKILAFCIEGMEFPPVLNKESAIDFIDPKLNHKREINNVLFDTKQEN